MIMKCFRCKKTSEFRLDNKYSCKRCFCDVIEKRVRKELRINKLLVKNDKVLILDDSSPGSSVVKYLINNIIKDPTIKIDMKKVNKIELSGDYKDYDKVIVPFVMDDEIVSYLDSYFNNNNKSKEKEDKFVMPLIVLRSDEVLNFAETKKLVFKKSKRSNDDIKKMVDNLEKKYPGTYNSIFKTIRKTRN